MEGDYLVLEQDSAFLAFDAAGTVIVSLPAVGEDRESGAGLSAIIEEDVGGALQRGLAFTHGVLERIDPTHQVSDIVLAAALQNVGYMPWRTRAEHAASPDSITMRVTASDVTVELTPPSRSRPTLQHQARELAEDLTTLLRRAMSGQ